MLENYQSCQHLQHTQLNVRTPQLQEIKSTWFVQGEELKCVAVCWRQKTIAVYCEQLS